MKTNLRQFCFCAVFTALCAVCAQIQIPLPMVPINLALFAVHLAGALLGAKRGVAAVAAYVMLGALGAPVFAGFAGGVQVIMGKTGGYLLGYLIAALLVGLLRARWGIGYWRLCFAMALGTAGCYFFRHGLVHGGHGNGHMDEPCILCVPVSCGRRAQNCPCGISGAAACRTAPHVWRRNVKPNGF